MTLRILVVDDSKSATDFNINLLDTLRNDFPHTIETAHDGLSAIIKVADTPSGFDLVLMDVEMPRADGFEATRKMKLVAPNLRIALLTSRAGSEDFYKGRNAGCNHYLLKPLRVSDLRTVLRLTSLTKSNSTNT